ncbi:ATP12 family chaperone protein [uncultured Sphingomonas sp.]|uniref:ATP12 family chaperone protein n=1 Tax=uncultured Sphingomonas sp. TaxID=158754 RepID=UPI0035C95517
MKRFWTEVSVDSSIQGGRVVRLDARPVRTPGRVPLALPTDALAQAVAEEWRSMGETIDPRATPLTGLANAAIDRIAPNPAAFAATLARYAETDLLCYRAETPEPLVERQAALWDPPLAWARGRYDVGFEIVAGIMHRPQPPATVARLGEAIAARSAWELAPLSPIVTLTGSLILALALVEGAIDPDTAWRASELDFDWQAELWGADPLAEGARLQRRAEFDAAVRFLGLARTA